MRATSWGHVFARRPSLKQTAVRRIASRLNAKGTVGHFIGVWHEVDVCRPGAKCCRLLEKRSNRFFYPTQLTTAQWISIGQAESLDGINGEPSGNLALSFPAILHRFPSLTSSRMECRPVIDATLPASASLLPELAQSSDPSARSGMIRWPLKMFVTL